MLSIVKNPLCVGVVVVVDYLSVNVIVTLTNDVNVSATFLSIYIHSFMYTMKRAR